MKVLKKALLSLAWAAALAASMTATAAVVTDTISYNPDQPVATFHSYSYTHDISDNGYTVGADRLLSAVLKLRLTDSFDLFDLLSDDFYAIKIGSSQLETGSHIQNFTFNSATGGKEVSFLLNGASLADLAQDGQIDVRLSTNSLFSSAFFLANSTLTGASAGTPEHRVDGNRLFGYRCGTTQTRKKEQGVMPDFRLPALPAVGKTCGSVVTKTPRFRGVFLRLGIRAFSF